MRTAYQALDAKEVSIWVFHKSQLLQLRRCRCCTQQRMFHGVGVAVSHLHATM